MTDDKLLWDTNLIEMGNGAGEGKRKTPPNVAGSVDNLAVFKY